MVQNHTVPHIAHTALTTNHWAALQSADVLEPIPCGPGVGSFTLQGLAGRCQVVGYCLLIGCTASGDGNSSL